MTHEPERPTPLDPAEPGAEIEAEVAGEPAEREPTEREQEEQGEREQAPEPPPLGDDFADEHAGATFADQMRGGPEGTPESESPEGLAGMDPD